MYELLPFRYELQEEKVFLTNEVGEYVYLTKKEFQDLKEFKIKPNSELFYDLKSKWIISSGNIDSTINALSIKYRTKKGFLFEFTTLHMIVTTLFCNSDCSYCHASSKNPNDKSFSINIKTAKNIVNTILKSPNKKIKIEFQGGEPLMNYNIIKFIISYTKALNSNIKKDIEFVVCSNLLLINKSMLNFFKKHNVYLSTSFDGPEKLHSIQRPTRKKMEKNSYQQFLEKLRISRKILGNDKVSALMTATKSSLSSHKDIIDSYLNNGFKSIFLRRINPFGMAEKNKDKLSYSIDDFLKFYKNSLDYILSINSNGTLFIEEFTSILFRKIMTPFSTGFVDLQSPAGVGIQGVIYNYNGDVFVSDEGRMWDAMGGGKTFKMGNVEKDSYQNIFNSEFLHNLIVNSTLESSSRCAYCPYIHFCGSDPVKNHVLYGNTHIIPYDTDQCFFIKKSVQYIIHKINENELYEKIFWTWITNKSLQELSN